METENIPQDGPSDWRREPSEQRNAILGKLGEEASELSARCFRSIIQGLDELDPDSNRENICHLQDEIADVLAQIDLALTYLSLDDQGIGQRRAAKLRYKRPWIEALPDVR